MLVAPALLLRSSDNMWASGAAIINWIEVQRARAGGGGWGAGALERRGEADLLLADRGGLWYTKAGASAAACIETLYSRS